MRAPEKSGIGKATARLSFEAWPEGKVAPSTFEFAILPAKPGPTPEAVTTRIYQELIHPQRRCYLTHLQFSPDGKRLIAGSYPEGVIQVWDVTTGKQLTKLETGRRGSYEYFHVTPDWRTLYTEKFGKTQRDLLEQDGKQLFRWTFGGEVRAYDLDTGGLRSRYQHTPPRHVYHAIPSPDGTTLFTLEELPGVYTGRLDNAATLWNLRTGQPHLLPVGTGWGSYSADGKTVVCTQKNKQLYVTALKLLDVPSGQEKLTIPITQSQVWIEDPRLTPDGKLIVASYRVFARAQQYSEWELMLKFWDATTGKEVASLPGMENTSFSYPKFSPDGRTLVATGWRATDGKLFCFDLHRRQLVKTVVLARPTRGDENVVTRQPVFSPDGKWLAAMTQLYPKESDDELQPEEIPQPRIHLLDAATGEIHETIVLPSAFSASLCFSPDGKTLAVGGLGRVLLLDMTKPKTP